MIPTDTEQQLTITPIGPVTDVLHIDMGDNMQYEKAVLYAIDGKVIDSYEPTGSTLTVNMRNMRAGLYYMVFIDIRTEERQMVRIFKQ